MDIIGFQGQVVFDVIKPDGAPSKLMDVSRMANLGWRAGINLYDGIDLAYKDFLKRLAL